MSLISLFSVLPYRTGLPEEDTVGKGVQGTNGYPLPESFLRKDSLCLPFYQKVIISLLLLDRFRPIVLFC